MNDEPVVPTPDEVPPVSAEDARLARHATWNRNIEAVLFDIYQTTHSYLLVRDYKMEVEIALFGDFYKMEVALSSEFLDEED